MNLSNDEKLAQLERILQSQIMHGSESLRAFLRFVVQKALDQQEDQLKEYTIATEVFGRGEQYSPRTDSVVRVQASRLRSKLQEYYFTEGKCDSVLIELPKGHYTPSFSYFQQQGNGAPVALPELKDEPVKEDSLAPISAVSAPATRPAQEMLRRVGVPVLIFVLLAAVALLAFDNVSRRSQANDGSGAKIINEWGTIWRPFLNGESPTLLVLSNPPVYRFTNPADPEAITRRALTLPPEQTSALTEALGDKFIVKNNPAPRIALCVDEYTGMGEAIGLYQVTALFGSGGRNVLLKQSRTVSAEDLKSHNVITLGSVWTNEWSGKLPINEDFMHTGSATIINHNPQPGEEREYRPAFDVAGKLVEDYALITLKPNISDKNTVMVLAGIHSEGTQAAAEFATTKEYIKMLDERLRQIGGASGPPQYYQALLKVAVDNGIPTKMSLLAVHSLQPASN
ncbi:MAG: hypothetical protein ACJ74J_06500 [Blastocatellia bacterium]